MYKFIIIMFLTSLTYSQEFKIVDIDNHEVYVDCGKLSTATGKIVIVNFNNTSTRFTYDLDNSQSKYCVTVPKGRWIMILYDKGKEIAKSRVFKID